MLDTFLDKATGLLDQRFLTVYWFPVFIAGVISLWLAVLPWGLEPAWTVWEQQSQPIQIWLPVLALLLVTILAYLLSAFTGPLVRLYEGYWPYRLRRWSTRRVEKRWEALRQQRREMAQQNHPHYASLQQRLHYNYPAEARLLLPTRLGNVLRAAEIYPRQAYGLDAVFWWPRLGPLLPAAVQGNLETVITPFLTLLNLATVSSLVGVGGALYLSWQQVGGWLGPLTALLGGLLLARLSYLAAASQAVSYGLQIRAAFDLYRFELLKQLHQPLPASPQEERQRWSQLESWLYNQDRGLAQELTYGHDQ